MKSNELRVGNWVNNNEENYRITSATIVQLERGDSTVIPIELTEFWLIDCGFVDNGFSFIKGDFEVTWAIRVVSNNQRSCFYLSGNIPESWKIRIKYVHELQNLYFAITGDELIF